MYRLSLIDLRLKQGRKISAPVLSRELEVSVRTLYRDFAYLRDRLGAPIEFDEVARSYRYTEPGFSLPAVTLTEGELVALFLAERTLRQYRGTPYEADIRSAFDKIVAFLPTEVSIYLGGLESIYTFRSSVTSTQDVERFRRLARATLQHERLRITYHGVGRDRDTRREIDPYHLANIDGEWYLFAHCHLRDEVRVFRPDRIRNLTCTGDAFETPPNFSPSAHLDGALGIYGGGTRLHKVVLEFDPFGARFIREKIWHASQEVTDLADGGCRLVLRLSAFVEVKRFALGWGRHCRVVHPKALVALMVGELRETQGLYGPAGALALADTVRMEHSETHTAQPRGAR